MKTTKYWILLCFLGLSITSKSQILEDGEIKIEVKCEDCDTPEIGPNSK